MEEGCLSLDAAGVTLDIERPLRVTVEARSPVGDELRIEAEGLEARVLQHESDHLDGVLITRPRVPGATPGGARQAPPAARAQPVAVSGSFAFGSSLAFEHKGTFGQTRVLDCNT